MSALAYDFDRQGHLAPVPHGSAGKPPRQQDPRVLRLDRRRDGLLTSFGIATLKDRYLLAGEGPQDMFARVAAAFADDRDHAQRLYDAMSRLWFMPATPILSNGGTARGLPISCFLNVVPDSLDGIVATAGPGGAHAGSAPERRRARARSTKARR